MKNGLDGIQGGNMRNGGYVRGPLFCLPDEDPRDIKRFYCIAWGKIVKDPYETFRTKKYTKFRLRVGRGRERDQKYLDCEAYGINLQNVIASALAKGDVVLCCGQWVEKRAKTRKHLEEDEQKWWFALRVGFLIPLELVAFLLEMYNTPEARKMVQKYVYEEPDDWDD